MGTYDRGLLERLDYRSDLTRSRHLTSRAGDCGLHRREASRSPQVRSMPLLLVVHRGAADFLPFRIGGRGGHRPALSVSRHGKSFPLASPSHLSSPRRSASDRRPSCTSACQTTDRVTGSAAIDFQSHGLERCRRMLTFHGDLAPLLRLVDDRVFFGDAERAFFHVRVSLPERTVFRRNSENLTKE